MRFDSGCGGHHACNCVLDKVEELQDENKRLKAALEYYAQGSELDWDLIGMDDRYGEMARVALIPEEADDYPEVH